MNYFYGAMLALILAGGMAWPAFSQKEERPVEPKGMFCRLSNLETVSVDFPAPGAKSPVYLWLEGMVFNPGSLGRVIPALRLSLDGCPVGPERLRGQSATFSFPGNLAAKESNLPKFDPCSRAWRLREARDFQVNNQLPYNDNTWAWYHVEDFPGYYVFEVTDLATNATVCLKMTSILPYPQGSTNDKPILLRRVVLTNRVDELRAEHEGEQVNFGRPVFGPIEKDVRDPDAAYDLGNKVRARWPLMAAEMFRRAGMGALEQKDAQKSIGYFEKILKDFPECKQAPEIQARLVRAYGVAGESEKARALAEKMSKADPGDHWCKLARTMVALSSNDYTGLDRPWMTVRPTVSPPRIDGNLDDACWQRAPDIPSLSVNDKEERWATNFPTMVWSAYDRENLYLGFRCFIDSRQISVKALARDEAVWADECVEVFLSPGLNCCYYYELEINPLNTVYDGKNLNHYWIQPGWNPSWQNAVRVRKQYWEVEMAVPFASLGTTTPVSGDAWLANLCRLIGPITGMDKPFRQCQSWSPGVNDFHQLVDYGVLIFGK